MQSEPEQPTSRPSIDGARAAKVFRTLISAPEEKPESAPPSIDGYRIVGHAGAGGQGTTWIAEPVPAGNAARGGAAQVAIKVLRYSARGFPRQYWAELEALANLRLACLPRVVDAGIADGFPWLATEFIEGTDLVEFERARSREEIIDAIARSADALSTVHAAGYVHRDIKPSNILVRTRDGAAMIIDLGLACRSGASAVHESIVGTPEFMSAEQARGEPCTAASDQWSLAATAFLMLTGETPHPVLPTVAEQIACARTAPARPARSVAPALSPAIAAVLDRALSQDASRRFGDCMEFAQRLRDAAGGRKPPSPGRYRSIAAGIVLVLIATGLIWALVPGPDAALRTLASGDYPEIEFGRDIAVIGDLDGDGLDEVAISAPKSPGRTTPVWRDGAGEIFIYNGRMIAGLAQLEPHIVSGPRAHGALGRALSAVGDVDGDGIPEFGCYLARLDGTYDTVAVFRGSAKFALPGRTDLADHPRVMCDADMFKGPLRQFAGADLDDDGFGDVVAGEANRGPDRRGGLLILRGARDFFATPPTPQRIPGPEGFGGFGCSIRVVRSSSTLQPLLVVGAPVGTHENGIRGHVVVMDRGFRVLHAFVGARELDWFGESIDAALENGVLRIAVGATGIAREFDDSGRAYLLEIAESELRSPTAPVDVDGPGGAPFVRARIASALAAKTGTGDLCGSGVALLGGAWVVTAPRFDSTDVNVGRAWLGDPGAEAFVDGSGDREQLGTGLAIWRGPDQSLVLLGAPHAGVGDAFIAGLTQVVELPLSTNGMASQPNSSH